MQLYFDNAATSYPKPDVVLDAIVQYQYNCGASPGRGAYLQAVEATNLLEIVVLPDPDKPINHITIFKMLFLIEIASRDV